MPHFSTLKLHWLPIKYRIIFKQRLLIFKTIVTLKKWCHKSLSSSEAYTNPPLTLMLLSLCMVQIFGIRFQSKVFKHSVFFPVRSRDSSIQPRFPAIVFCSVLFGWFPPGFDPFMSIGSMIIEFFAPMSMPFVV